MTERVGEVLRAYRKALEAVVNLYAELDEEWKKTTNENRTEEKREDLRALADIIYRD